MAITILQYPSHPNDNSFNVIMPVYNDIAFTVDSSNKSECGFQYVCDVYVNTIFIKRLKLFPKGVDGYATFKVQRVIEDSLSYDLHQNLYGSSLFASNENSICFYNLKFGEEYDNSAQCNAGTNIYPDLAESDDVVAFMAFNGALQKKEWLLWYDTNYQASNSNAKFLTGFPNRALITPGSQMTFNIFNANVLKLQVVTYDSAGAAIATYTYTNTLTTLANAEEMLLTIGVGPENLNNSTLLSGVQPVIDSDVYYYTVQTLGSLDAPTSEVKRIDIDKREVKWTPHRLWWLGRLGGFDSYTFTLKDSRSLSISRTEFSKLIGEYRDLSPGATWTYDVSNRGRTTLNVSAQQSKTFISNWLTEREALWMEELFTSLETYESTVNKEICFNQIELDGGDININVGYDTGLAIGDIVAINILIGESEYALLIDEFEITGTTENTITIPSPFDPFDPDYPPTGAVCGCMTVVDFVSELNPLIIKNNSWEEKVKSKIKNINYSIEVDESDSVNVQRN